MKSFKLISLFIILVMVLVACGGGQQVRQESAAPAEQDAADSGEALAGDIPVYPDAKDYETGNNMMVDALVDPMVKQFESQYGGKAEVNFFAVPQGTTAQDIESFYTEKMTGMGWQAGETQSANGATTMVWTKDDKNVFVLSFMEIPQMEPMLMTVVAEQS
jgi:hypothetical protein